ncbi:MAG: hypothetical protein SFY56_14965 [Bacteroidota bacterium]|nr:hypothetical protein [Bacteroidota bacterium]
MNLIKQITTILLCLFFINNFSQEKERKTSYIEIDIKKPETWDKGACDSITIINKDRGFKSIIKNEFTKVVNGSSDLNIGSFASLDVTKATGVFKYTSADNNGNLYTLGATGGIDEGVFNLFTDKKPNSNMDINFTGHFLNVIKQIGFSAKECNEALLAIRKERKRINALMIEARIKVKLDSALNKLAVDCRNDPCPTIPYDRKGLADTNFIKLLQCGKNACVSQADSLRYEYNLALHELAKQKLESKLDSLHKVLEKKEKELAKLNVKTLKMRWLSLGGSYKNNSFKLLNETDSVIKTQLTKQIGNVFSLNLAYNFYRWQSLGFSTYFNINASIKASDNFDDLSKKDITDTYKLNNGNVTREYNTKTTAYSGIYKSSFLALNFASNLYLFLFKNKAAIHLWGDVNFDSKNEFDLDFERPIYDASIGLLLCPIDAKDKSQRSIQNVELFIKLKDVFNGFQNINNYDKTIVGLRFTTPINFK